MLSASRGRASLRLSRVTGGFLLEIVLSSEKDGHVQKTSDKRRDEEYLILQTVNEIYAEEHLRQRL